MWIIIFRSGRQEIGGCRTWSESSRRRNTHVRGSTQARCHYNSKAGVSVAQEKKEQLTVFQKFIEFIFRVATIKTCGVFLKFIFEKLDYVHWSVSSALVISRETTTARDHAIDIFPMCFDIDSWVTFLNIIDDISPFWWGH